MAGQKENAKQVSRLWRKKSTGASAVFLVRLFGRTENTITTFFLSCHAWKKAL